MYINIKGWPKLFYRTLVMQAKLGFTVKHLLITHTPFMQKHHSSDFFPSSASRTFSTSLREGSCQQRLTRSVANFLKYSFLSKSVAASAGASEGISSMWLIHFIFIASKTIYDSVVNRTRSAHALNEFITSFFTFLWPYAYLIWHSVPLSAPLEKFSNSVIVS